MGRGGGGQGTRIYFSWVETSWKVEFHPPRLPRHGRFMVGDNKQKTKNSMNIPLVPMGVFAPVSAHMGPSAQPPIGTSGIIRHACLQSRFHQISPFSGRNTVNWGCRGDSPNIFFIGFLIFLLLRSPWKISKL